MDKYVFLYIDPPDFAERMGALSNEQMQQQLQSWFDWLGGGREAGGLVDDGNAQQISIADVLRAGDEAVDATQCGGRENCQHGSPCLTHDLWAGLTRQIKDFLGSVSLDDLIARQPGGREPELAGIPVVGERLDDGSPVQ